jgi:rhodanese-related sulfurtransferase
MTSLDLQSHAQSQPHTLSPEQVEPAQGYAGDITVQTAYAWWQASQALLVDVRSKAELVWVGFVPGAVHIPWAEWFASPAGMQANASFESQLEQAMAANHGQPRVLFLCRSGARSVSAARLANGMGFMAYNILDGFEGPPDAQGHRNHTAGWRWAGLPWQQG